MLEILDADEEFLIGVRGNFLVNVWGRMTVERLRRIYAAEAPVVERLASRGFGSLNVILPRRSNQLPGTEEWKEKLVKLVAPYAIGSAIVIEGDGLLAKMARGTVSTMQTIRAPKYPQKTFANVEEAARWLVPLCAPRTGDTFSPADIAWDVSAARAQMGALAARD